MDPSRFIRNQFRKCGFRSREVGKLQTIQTFHSDHFTVVNGEGISEQIRSYGIFEADLTEAFLRLVKPGQVVVDIGMHLGYYTTLFAQLVGETGEVHAFEPTPSTRELAMNNVGHLSRVSVHPKAVWSSVQTITFRDHGIQWLGFNSATDAQLEDGCPKPKLIQVETETLDVFRRRLSRPIDLLKVDAEGAEHEIIAGASELLAADWPLVSLEVGDAEGKFPSHKLVEQMSAAGYVAWEFKDRSFQRHLQRSIYPYGNLIFARKGTSLDESSSS